MTTTKVQRLIAALPESSEKDRAEALVAKIAGMDEAADLISDAEVEVWERATHDTSAAFQQIKTQMHIASPRGTKAIYAHRQAVQAVAERQLRAALPQTDSEPFVITPELVPLLAMAGSKTLATKFLALGNGAEDFLAGAEVSAAAAAQLGPSDTLNFAVHLEKELPTAIASGLTIHSVAFIEPLIEALYNSGQIARAESLKRSYALALVHATDPNSPKEFSRALAVAAAIANASEDSTLQSAIDVVKYSRKGLYTRESPTPAYEWPSISVDFPQLRHTYDAQIEAFLAWIPTLTTTQRQLVISMWNDPESSRRFSLHTQHETYSLSAYRSSVQQDGISTHAKFYKQETLPIGLANDASACQRAMRKQLYEARHQFLAWVKSATGDAQIHGAFLDFGIGQMKNRSDKLNVFNEFPRHVALQP